MKRLKEFHQYLGDGRPHNLDAILCVDLTYLRFLRSELCQSDPATIDLLSDTFGQLIDPHNCTPPCQLFSVDELMGTIEPLPGLRLYGGELVRIEANDPSISADDRRHYVSHDLLSQVVNKLSVALNEHLTTEDTESMPAGTLDALQRLSLIVMDLVVRVQR